MDQPNPFLSIHAVGIGSRGFILVSEGTDPQTMKGFTVKRNRKFSEIAMMSLNLLEYKDWRVSHCGKKKNKLVISQAADSGPGDNLVFA